MVDDLGFLLRAFQLECRLKKAFHLQGVATSGIELTNVKSSNEHALAWNGNSGCPQETVDFPLEWVEGVRAPGQKTYHLRGLGRSEVELRNCEIFRDVSMLGMNIFGFHSRCML